MREGETIEIATRLREPVMGEEDTPTSFNSIKIQMTTSGTMKDLDDVSELSFEFPEVENLSELADEWDS